MSERSSREKKNKVRIVSRNNNNNMIMCGFEKKKSKNYNKLLDVTTTTSHCCNYNAIYRNVFISLLHKLLSLCRIVWRI